MLELTLKNVRMLARNPDFLNHVLPAVGIDGDFRKIVGIVNSMTRREQDFPFVAIDASRLRRIAAGAGASEEEVSGLLQRVKEANVRVAQLELERRRRMA